MAGAPKAPTGPSTHDRIITGAGHARTALAVTDTGGKPSVKRGAAGGAIGGAVAGAGLGSAVAPGPGTAIGALGGAVVGGAAGGVKAHGAKKAARRAKLAALGPGRQMLVAEFLVCMVILALSPLTDRHQQEGPQAFLKRGAATMAVFFILAMISSAGRGPTKVAAMGGGLITLSLLVSDRDVFAALADKLVGGATQDDGFQGADTLGVNDTATPGPGLDPSGQVSDSAGSPGLGLDPSGTTGTLGGGPLGNGIR